MSAIIKVDNLSKQYHEVKAVNDISFTVNKGDIYGFLGQNGAGKSTTIRMLLTLIAPTTGTIELFGKNLHSHRKEVLQQIGAVIEKPDLYKYLSGYENLSLFAKMSGVPVTAKKLNDQLEQVGLTERAHSKVRTYSQGMKQRLGIAIALIHDPQLIILDEPTNGLDPQGIADIRNLILHLSRHQGKTILVSSHLLHEIELIANRMLIIDKGKKIMEGTVAELVDPARTLVHLEVTNPQQVVAWLQSSRWSTCLREYNNAVILLQMNKAQVPELTAGLVRAGASIMALQPQNSLESYFLSLTTENRHVDTFTN
jgi:ABC-2 type transport system ATP-binding protein